VFLEPAETRGVTVTTLQADNLIIGLLQDVVLLTVSFQCFPAETLKGH